MVGRMTGLLAVLALGTSAFAWNGTGHKVVAQIAWDQLSPEVRAKASALLEKHPQYKDLIEEKNPPTPEEGKLAAFLTAATWSDLIRTPTGRNRIYQHSNWHYLDYPLVIGKLPEGSKPEEQVTEWKAGTDPKNILQAMAKCTADLRDPKTTDDQKAVALTWMMHLIGDIEQPLHTTSAYSVDFPEGDRGGNSWMVTAGGSVWNLHSLWDGLLGGYEDNRATAEIAGKIEKEYPRAKLAEELKVTSFKAWSEESNKEAIAFVYLNGKLPGMTKEAQTANKKAPVPAVPADYLDNAKALARKKMALGGYRLADYLNATLGGK
jgi:hypothetical protein